MMGPLSDLSASSHLDEGAKGTLNRVLNHAKRLLHLVNQLLVFQRAEASSLSLHIRRTDLAAVIKDVAEAFTVEAGSRKLRFSINCRAQLYFSSDKEKIDIVLKKLFYNTFKLT